MLNSKRLLLVPVAAALLFAAACGGSSDANSEDAVRDDVNALFDSVFGDEIDIEKFASFFPEECAPDTGELALGLAFLQAFLGEADIEFEINEVTFPADDRAIVTVTSSGGFDLFGATAEGGESKELLVLQDGRWRSTSDCEPYDAERAELGISTSSDSGTDFGSDFGSDDFGPPVAASVGQALPVGGLIVTINGASLSADALNEFDDPPQGVLVVVDFTFKNDGQEPTSPWWALKMSLFDDRDRTWEPVALPFDDVGPGFSQDFQVAWDVPEDATGFRVVVSADPFVDLPLPDDFAPWEVSLGDVN